MSFAVYKYTLRKAQFHTHETISVPVDAELLDVQWQHEAIVLWFRVDLAQQPEERTFFLAATGVKYAELDPATADYCGTVQVPHSGLVVHVFELPEGAE